MGVDCGITLPPAARLRDVADVIGALAGLPMRRRQLDDRGAWAAHCEGIRYSGYEPETGLAECAKIEFHSPTVKRDCYVMYHFEWDRYGNRGLLPRSTSFWIAIGLGLVDFFGGSVDYSDCDHSDIDYEQPARSDIHAEDGEEWDSFQSRKMEVKALTQEDLEACASVAAY